jgi:hypothetical protein
MPSSKGLDGTRQSCFVIATSMPPAPSPDLLRAEPRGPKSLAANSLGSKHKAESGHLDAAVDIAAMPLIQRSFEVAAFVPAPPEAAMSLGRHAA